MAAHELPEDVLRLFWEVDPAAVDLDRHADYVMEQVMSRSGLTAMRWLRVTYAPDRLADFLVREASGPDLASTVRREAGCAVRFE